MRYASILAITVAAITCLGSNFTYGQSNPPKPSLGKTIKDISTIFKKGTKKTTQPASDKTENAPVIGKGNAGELSPDAVSLAVDRMLDFNNGVAVVSRGSSSALINAKGAFVVPFNTYDLPYYTYSVLQYVYLSNGLFHFRTMDQQQWGYMNSSGKVIAIGVLNSLTDNKRVLEINNSGHWAYTTPDGKKYSPGDQLYEINEGIGIVRRQVQSSVYISYKRLNGTTLPAGTYDELYHFSEGLAVVGKKNQYGEVKYGYINTDGKLVIPLLYSIKPSEFSGGYAKVVPKDKTEFEYAFINKKGEIVFKQTQADVYKNGPFDHFTAYGIAFSPKYVMDANFKMTSKADFFKSYGLPADSWLINEQSYVEGETNPKLLYSTRGVVGRYTQLPLTGFINFATGKVVAPVFDLLNVNLFILIRWLSWPMLKYAWAKAIPEGWFIAKDILTRTGSLSL